VITSRSGGPPIDRCLLPPPVRNVRSAAQVHSPEFKACVALQAQYIFDRFGKFPATVPAIQVLMYLQAHHLDLDFYDQHFAPGAYLGTHATHMARWHPDLEGRRQ
jgi:hypothetical protein